MPEKDLTDGAAQLNIATSRKVGIVNRGKEWVEKTKTEKDLKENSVCNVSFSKEALMNEFAYKSDNKGCVKFVSLIDTGASMSIMSYKAWKQIGKPRMKPCPVTSILLGDNGEVPVEGMTDIKIRIGDQWHPIDCLVVKNWRYDVIISLDFMTTINACIKITTKELIVGTTHKEVCNLITTALQSRSVRPICALDDTIIKATHCKEENPIR